MDHDATWYGGRLRAYATMCSMWTQLHLEKGAHPPHPIFGPFLLWPNGWMQQDATWYGGRPQPRRLCVRWGLSSIPQKGRSHTQFSAHVYCGQTAAWIKMPLGMEVGLGLRDIVFDVDPAALRKKGTTVRPMLWDRCLSVCPVCNVDVLWPNSWMDQDETLHGGRPRPWPHCVRWGLSSPSEKGSTAAPTF